MSATKAGSPKFDTGYLNLLPPGEVRSMAIEGRLVRKETHIIDGERFHRFTLDPGMKTEFQTFWSPDAFKLLKGLSKKLGISMLDL